MSDMDPKKLKVAELREELKTRALDTKGNKAQLVKRLEKALSAENGGAEVDLDDSQDASAIDTSHDFSMDEEPEGQQAMPEMRAPPVHIEDEEPELDSAQEAEEPEDAQQIEDEPEEESYPEAQQEEAHQEPAAAEEDLNQEPAEEPEKMQEDQEEQQESKQAALPADTEEAKAATESETTEAAESEAPEADQKETATAEGGKPQAGNKRRRDEDGDGRHHRDRHHRSRFDDKPLNIEMENDDWVKLTTVVLDKYNSDLNLRVHESGTKANPITVEGFAFMWAGARSTYGVTSGKMAYEVKLLEQLSVDHLPADETSRHVVRVGYSVDSSSLQLGEEKLSYGYGGTAKASTECNFKDYGEKFAEGDVIGAYVDYESEPIVISYTKNGEDLGTCFEIPVADLEGKALFPHILTKNTEFEVNFGQNETPFFPTREGYTMIATLEEDQRVRGAMPPAEKKECEMIMMCGLPGSGKTTWAAKHAQENLDKKFNVLGTNNIIDKMKVMGLPRKKNYAGRWDMLIDKATKCLNRMLEIAAKKKRNYILDQTNVYPSAQRRKMRPFEGFQRKAVVIVPTDEEYKKRCEQREKEEGKEVPDSAVLEMKANFQLPEEGQLFDKVEYVEQEKEEATKLTEEYSKDAQSKLPPPEKRFNRGNYGYGRDRGRDNRSGGYGRDKYGSGGGGSYDRNKNGRGYRRGGYMGYSQQDRNKHDNRTRSSGSGSWGGKQGSWGGNQGGWGNQSGWGNQGGWGNQSGWGNQGWGNQGSWNNQGQWNYGNQGNNQGWNQGYNYWGNNQGWGSYGTGQQQTGQGYWGGQSNYNYTPK